jgi:hypothetical protein
VPGAARPAAWPGTRRPRPADRPRRRGRRARCCPGRRRGIRTRSGERVIAGDGVDARDPDVRESGQLALEGDAVAVAAVEPRPDGETGRLDEVGPVGGRELHARGARVAREHRVDGAEERGGALGDRRGGQGGCREVGHDDGTCGQQLAHPRRAGRHGRNGQRVGGGDVRHGIRGGGVGDQAVPRDRSRVQEHARVGCHLAGAVELDAATGAVLHLLGAPDEFECPVSRQAASPSRRWRRDPRPARRRAACTRPDGSPSRCCRPSR